MRLFWPLVIFIVGLLILGFWAKGHDALDMQADITEDARALVADNSRHGAEVSVSGRDIELSGLLHDTAERDRLIAELNDVEGRRVVRADKIELLPVAAPYKAGATKDAGLMSLSTNLPDSQSVASLRAALPEGTELTESLASGMPNAAWPEVLRVGMSGLDKLESGSLSLEGSNMVLTGRAASQDMRSEFDALSSQVGEGYSFETNIDFPEPYAITVTKPAQGAASIAGIGPSDLDTGALGVVLGLEGMTGTVGPDASGKGSEIIARAMAMDTILPELESYELTLGEKSLSLMGRAKSPASEEKLNAFFAGLPAGIAATNSVEIPKPYDLTMTFDANDGVNMSGRAPDGVTAIAVAEALNVPSLGVDVEGGAIGDADDIISKITGVAPVLSEFEAMELALSEARTKITGETLERSDLAAIDETLSSALPNVDVDLSTTSRSYAPGTARTNAITGRTEYYNNGYWLPSVSGFDATVAECKARSSALMQSATIDFVSGSDQLDASARSILDRLAGLVNYCVSNTSLALQVAGHTDSQGDEDANYRLSLARVDAVKAALVERGIRATKIFTRGFGETQPIADNATAEGRAQNRRTEFNWIDAN